MAPRTHVDQALILRRFHYGESSLVLQVLARERGRVHLIARGAYRPKSRYYAALDLFDTLELEWGHAPGRELQNLREASILERRARIATELPRFRAATTALELAALAAREDQPGRELFELLRELLDELAAPPAARLRDASQLRDAGSEPDSEADCDLALARFELGLLAQLGLAPALVACAACAGPAPGREGRAAFSAGAGGRLCADCAATARRSGRRVGTMPVDVLERARDLLAPGDSAGGTMRAPSTRMVAPERVRDLVARFLEYHLESRPKSYRRFLAVPNRNRPEA